MNNQSNKDQKNFNRQTDRVSHDQKRSDFQRDQRSSGAQRNVSPDAKRSAPNDTGLNE
jgi:hypothetical protein